MALINDIYVFVESENVKRDAKVSEHPVEEGIDLTDHVRRSPITLSISGEIVGDDYEDTIAALDAIHKNGELVEYIGVNMISNALITSFPTEHTGEIAGGCRFTMELREIRIASSPYTAGSGSVGTQQVEEHTDPESTSTAKTYEVQNGDTLWRIAQASYGNGALFPVIFEANRDKLSDPDRIRPGQVLTIP
ncbi:MAG: LysM peptidoglycan-binding domain-containing protein [Lachnospiraceae bacterium]|nr:LysM peptidoglycan-binding domain-containing protein [Lachnospiraceae bacterium]